MMNLLSYFILRSINKRQDQKKYQSYRKETDSHSEKECLLWPRQAWPEDPLKSSYVSFTIMRSYKPSNKY